MVAQEYQNELIVLISRLLGNNWPASGVTFRGFSRLLNDGQCPQLFIVGYWYVYYRKRKGKTVRIPRFDFRQALCFSCLI